MTMLEEALAWYRRRAIAYCEAMPDMHSLNRADFLSDRVSLEGTVIVVRSSSPIVRKVIASWATEGERPPQPFTGIEARNV